MSVQPPIIHRPVQRERQGEREGRGGGGGEERERVGGVDGGSENGESLSGRERLWWKSERMGETHL